MFSLTPIHKNIQQRLFERMDLYENKKAANTNTIEKSKIKYEDLATKTPFIRMISNPSEIMVVGEDHPIEPVVMMGGELTAGTKIIPGNPITRDVGAATKIYRTEKQKTAGIRLQQDATGALRKVKDFATKRLNIAATNPMFGYDQLYSNSFNRPIAGVRSIEVGYKGGLKAHREGTINWTCWTFDELERLKEHFLSPGKSILLEWGWVYKSTAKDLMSYFDVTTNSITKSAFTDISDKVWENYGDFDSMTGLIKNFEWTTRDDGGFDCTTTLAGMGVNLLNNVMEEEDKKYPDKLAAISSEQVIRNRVQLNTLVKELEKPNPNEDTLTEAYETNLLLGMKTIGQNINDILDSLARKSDKAGVESDKIGKLYIDQHPFIESKIGNDIKKVILVEETTHGVSQSKSIGYALSKYYVIWKDAFIIEYIVRGKGGQPGVPSDLYFELQNAWVTWGWFEDNILAKFYSLINKNGDLITLLRSLEEIDGKERSTIISNHENLYTHDFYNYILPGKSVLPYSDEFYDIPDLLLKLAKLTDDRENFEPFQVGEKKDRGYLRNILVNTNTIKEMFGNIETGYSEPEQLTTMIETFVRHLNKHINFFDLEVIADERNLSVLKIVDQTVSELDLSKPKNLSGLEGDGLRSRPNKLDGIFYFPVWNSKSIVKKQNLTSKIPNAIQLAVMYGSNADQVALRSTPSTDLNIQGQIVGALHSKTKDSYLKGLEFTKRKKQFDTLGRMSGSPTGSIEKHTGFSLRAVYSDTLKTKLKDTYEERLAKVNKEMEDERWRDYLSKEKTDSKLPKDQPPPLPSFIKNEAHREKIGKVLKEFGLNDIYSFGGVLLSDFMISLRSAIFANTPGSPGKVSQDVLIPLDLELEVDGIGGIYPGNSFNSDYLPSDYQDKTVFQAFDINHRVDNSGWSTTIKGKMRTSFPQLNKIDTEGTTGEPAIFDETMKTAINAYNKVETKEEKKRTTVGGTGSVVVGVVTPGGSRAARAMTNKSLASRKKAEKETRSGVSGFFNRFTRYTMKKLGPK